VARGSAGRARISRGWLDSDAKRLMPAGVGVKGGGLMGDSDAAPLRLLGSGVAGKSGTTSLDSLVAESSSSCCVVAEVLIVLRFFGTAAGFSTFVYFATFLMVSSSDVYVTAVPLATRAERRRDMLKYFV
jgi:hypothetical protein